MSGHWARGYLGLAGADQNGGNGGGGVLKLVEGETTWQQVYDALAAGTPVLAPYVEDGTSAVCEYISAAAFLDGKYGVYLVGQTISTDSPLIIAETADGVLVANEGD